VHLKVHEDRITTSESEKMTILKNNVDFFIYFLEGKWRIGKNYKSQDCWIFSAAQRNGISEISANMDWFSLDKNGKIFRAPVTITSISSLHRAIKLKKNKKV